MWLFFQHFTMLLYADMIIMLTWCLGWSHWLTTKSLTLWPYPVRNVLIRCGVRWSDRSLCRCQITWCLYECSPPLGRWHVRPTLPCDRSALGTLDTPLQIPARHRRSGSAFQIQRREMVKGFRAAQNPTGASPAPIPHSFLRLLRVLWCRFETSGFVLTSCSSSGKREELAITPAR